MNLPRIISIFSGLLVTSTLLYSSRQEQHLAPECGYLFLDEGSQALPELEESALRVVGGANDPGIRSDKAWEDVGASARVWAASYGGGSVRKTVVILLESHKKAARVQALADTCFGCQQLTVLEGSRLYSDESGNIGFDLKLDYPLRSRTERWSGIIKAPLERPDQREPQPR